MAENFWECCDLHENWYIGVFGVADYEPAVTLWKFKVAESKYGGQIIKNSSIFINVVQNCQFCIQGFVRLLIKTHNQIFKSQNSEIS